MQKPMKVGIKEIEFYLPLEMEDDQVLLSENPGWSIEDIEQKTGIKTRCLAGDLLVIEGQNVRLKNDQAISQ
jgi:hypothetical protein